MDKVCVYCLAEQGEVQRLTDLAQHHGWTITQTLTEHPSTAPDRRAGLAAIRRMVAAGTVEAIVAPSVTLLGASLDQMVALIGRMAGGGVALIAEAEGIDTTTTDGAAWMSAVASLQTYREAVRRQAARAGQLRAKEAGVKLGRPPVAGNTIERVRIALAAGHGVRPTARQMGISAARVSAEKQAMAAERVSVPCRPEG